MLTFHKIFCNFIRELSMKLLKLCSFFILLASLAACQPKKNAPESEISSDLFRIKSQIIERFSKDAPTKELVDYVYENKDDFFWIKAVYKDETGAEIKTVERIFDANRTPIKELTKEMGIVTAALETKYDPTNYFLLDKVTFDGDIKDENKKAHYKYNFENSSLVSTEIEEFSQEADFKNAEGTKVVSYVKRKYIPAKDNRPKGFQAFYYFIEAQKEFATAEDIAEFKKEKNAKAKDMKVGDLRMSTITKFDAEGYPTFTETTQPDCSHDAYKQWFKTEKDGLGNVISITGFDDDKFTKVSATNTQTVLEYDQNAIIAKIEDFKYNEETKKYDRFHGAEKYTWKDREVKNPQNFLFLECALFKDSYCYGAEKYSVKDRRVVKFDANETVIEEYDGFYEGVLKERKVETTLRARISSKIEKFIKAPATK